MPRVKRGKSHLKRRKALLSKTKGMMWGRKSKIKQAKIAAVKAGQNAYKGRKLKKRTMRGLWQVRMGAAAKELGISYSKLIDVLKKADIQLDRKIMSQLAAEQPAVFKAVVETAKAKPVAAKAGAVTAKAATKAIHDVKKAKLKTQAAVRAAKVHRYHKS
jgi:large subunit ribosomal protein L20